MLTNKELGLYLRNIRESLGYSTYDVNKLCDISPSYLSLMETGKRKPSAIILKKLAPIYSLDYLDLYEKAGYIDLAEAERLNKNVFAKNLDHYMKINNTTLNRLIMDLDLNLYKVKSWYKGNKSPTIDELEMLANYLNIKKSDLIENKDDDFRFASYNGIDTTDLTDEEIDEIKRFVEFVKNKRKKDNSKDD